MKRKILIALVWVSFPLFSLQAQTANPNHLPIPPVMPPVSVCHNDDALCNDGNACTRDICGLHGCEHRNISYSDGDACTEDFCDRRRGVQHRPVTIEDQNRCTIDSCDKKEGVKHEKIDQKIDTPCSVGAGECSAEGVWQCNPHTAAVACSVQEGAPNPEICDGKDNNCDGAVDNLPDVGHPCEDGQGACHVNGVLECKPGGALGCSVKAGNRSEEICDGIDNDCNGQIDENLVQKCFDGPSYASNVGICRQGERACVQGRLGACAGEVLPANEEICGNHLDDDCNGEADEGCVAEKEKPKNTDSEKPAPIISVVVPSAAEKSKVEEPSPVVIVAQPLPSATKEPALASKPMPNGQPNVEPKVQPKEEPKPAPTAVKNPEPKPAATKEPSPQPATTKKPEPPKETKITKKPEPKVEPKSLVGTSCRSDIFDCDKTITLESPIKEIRASFTLNDFYENQIIVIAGSSLASLSSREIASDGNFAFHNCSLPEGLEKAVVANLNGNEKNDVVAVSASNQYQLLLDLDQTLSSHAGAECALSPSALFSFANPDERVFQNGAAEVRATVKRILGLKEIALPGGAVKILGAVELTTPDKRFLGLDVFTYASGSVSYSFHKIKEMDAAVNLRLARLEPIHSEVSGSPNLAVILASSEGIEWFDCSVAFGSFACEPNFNFAAVPLVGLNEQEVRRDLEHNPRSLWVTTNGDVLGGEEGRREGHARRRGNRPEDAEEVNPFTSGEKTELAHAWLEPVDASHDIFYSSSDALLGLRISYNEQEILSLEELPNENLTADSAITHLVSDDRIVYRYPTHLLPILRDNYGGIDLLASFSGIDPQTKERLKTVISFYHNKNETPHLDLASAPTEGDVAEVEVKAGDDMDDPLTCEVTSLQDQAGNDRLDRVVKADCQTIKVNLVGLAKASENAEQSAQSNINVGLSGGVAGSGGSLVGEMITTDAGGLSASKSFTLSYSGTLLKNAVAASDVEDTTADAPGWSVTGGGCSFVKGPSSGSAFASGLFLFIFWMIGIGYRIFLWILPKRYE